MYVVSADACSVQNSAQPVPASVVAAQRARLAAAMAAWDRAAAGFSNLVYGRTPGEFSDVGLPVQVEVARNKPGVSGDSSQRLRFRGGAPEGAGGSPCSCRLAGPAVVPLNDGRPVPLPPPAVLVTNQGPAVPTVAPVLVPVVPPAARPAAPAARPVMPRYSNLCYGVRHGMVDESQFDPAEYAALQLRCSQLGYAGACPPPAQIALYLVRGRAAGTLPHIAVSDAVLAALPAVPADLQTLGTCAESAARGGVGLGDYRCAAPGPAAAPANLASVPDGVLMWARRNPGTAGGLAAVLAAMAVSGLRLRGGV